MASRRRGHLCPNGRLASRRRDHLCPNGRISAADWRTRLPVQTVAALHAEAVAAQVVGPARCVAPHPEAHVTPLTALAAPRARRVLGPPGPSAPPGHT